MTPKITAALHEVMGKVGYVQKRSYNKFHQYNYAGEADLLDVLRPAMIEAGLILIPSGQEFRGPDDYGNTYVTMSYTLAHKDGEIWDTPIIAFGCGNDRNKSGLGDKGVYKAITGANKYLLFKLFQIETGDDPERGEAQADSGIKATAGEKAQAAKPADTTGLRNGMIQAIAGCGTPEKLNAIEDDKRFQADFERLSEPHKEDVNREITKKREAFEANRNLAA